MSAVATGLTLLHVRGACPIPVGHRIQVRTFWSRAGGGFFGLGEPKPDFHSPLLTDLETGINYGSLDYFLPPVNMYTPGQVFDASYAPLPEVREHSRWYAKVAVCNVLFTGYTKNEIQTTFLLEPIAPPNPGYR